MRIRYVGHACLQIRAAGLTLLTDPWWVGPAYARQWFQFPLPAADGVAEEPLDYLYVSHGHEDHLHPSTLATLPHHATVLVPELLGPEMRDFLADELGFADVLELRDGEPTRLRNGLVATAYVNLTDSVLVLRAPANAGRGERVLVNANDALHSAPAVVRRHLCRRIREREGPIDYLFCGYGGASFWPNCVHHPAKDDLATARAREAQLLDGFAEAAAMLRPRHLFPFAASVALLEPEKRWINDVRLGGPSGAGDGPIERFHHRAPDLAGQVRPHFPMPGDVIDGDEIRCRDETRPTVDSLHEATKGPLATDARSLAFPTPLSPAQVDSLFARLAQHVEQRYGAAARRLRTPATIEIDVREAHGDRPGDAPWTLRVGDGRALLERRPPAEPAGARICLRAEVLEAALATPYGIESITIGYGAELWFRTPAQVALLPSLLTLLSCKRVAGRQLLDRLWRSPARTLRYLYAQRIPLAVLAAMRTGLLPPEVRILAPATPEPPEAASANQSAAA